MLSTSAKSVERLQFHVLAKTYPCSTKPRTTEHLVAIRVVTRRRFCSCSTVAFEHTPTLTAAAVVSSPPPKAIKELSGATTRAVLYLVPIYTL